MPSFFVPVYRNARTDGVVGDDAGDLTGTIDTTALNTAAARGSTIRLKEGVFRVDNRVTLADGSEFVGEGIGKTILLFPTNYTADTVAVILGNNNRFENITIKEYQTDNQDSGLATATQWGLRMGSNNRIRNVCVEGFNFGFALFDGNDGNEFVDCDFTKSRVWNELDSAQYNTFTRTKFTFSGWDGVKLQSQSVTNPGKGCDGTKFYNCVMSDNGQRDFSNGGDENANGHGVDSFDGGNEIVIDGCTLSRNAGAGFVQKGSDDLSTGITITNSLIEDNRGTQSAPTGGHGIELGTDGSYNQRSYRITGNTIRNNNASGVFHHGGFMNTFRDNLIYGNDIGVNIQNTASYDLDLCSNTIVGNFQFNLIIGVTDSVSTSNRHINVTGGTISGLFNPAGQNLNQVPNISVTGTFDESDNTIAATAHGLSDGDCVSIREIASGALPAELAESTYYYVISSSANEFKISDQIDGTEIDFTDDGAGTATFSTNHTEWTCRTYQQMNDITFDGVRFFPGYNQNGVNLFGDKIKVKNSRFINFKRIALRMEGTGVVEDCVIENYDNDSAGASWAAVVLGGDADVIMNRNEFDNEAGLVGTTAILLEDSADVLITNHNYENYTVTTNNTGTGTIS